jgi:hypothetical protein
MQLLGNGSTEFRPGNRVIIRSNPHDPGVEQIVGTVVVLKPGAGFAGCTLADVEYRHPRTDESRIDSFSLACLDLADPRRLIELAEFHEAQAAELRELADAIQRL